jgi:hypothetical protein
MATARVCYLAQSEGKNTSECPKCAGSQLDTATFKTGPYSEPFYPAPYVFKGRTMTTYKVDDVSGPQMITGEYLDNVVGKGEAKVYLVPNNPGGFWDLCLFYDKEGGARINVAAAISGSIVHPKGTGKVTGADENCPIESAELGDSGYDLKNFVWADGLVTKWNVPASLNGGWTATPGAGKGKMVLHAKPYLPTDRFFVDCRFRHWEFNLLTPTQDEARIEESDTIDFDRNIFAGLIAHYEYVNHDADIHEPTRKPGEISIGDPAPKLFLVIGEHRVAYEIARLAEGSVRPIRNDPRSLAHGSVLKEPRMARDLRARIMRAARAATDLEHELRDLLLQLPPAAE